MADNRHSDDEPIRLVDEGDDSLTLVDVDRDDEDYGIREKYTSEAMFEDDPWEEEIKRIDTDFREETAAEFAARPNDAIRGDRDVDRDVTSGRGIGTFALVLSILSLFFLPVLLGAAGIIVGFISRANGAKALGNWAIGIGVISIIMTLFFSPFF
ncbi:DUF4190 domain-containing protein [bacterium LRH843]|nr:DUF4190 domain-containing protein [bacterium LRH843]